MKMDYNKEFLRMMGAQTAIALATTVDGAPNVRIVNFYYDPTARTLYFSTFGDNQKVQELEKNSQVAFTTLPTHGEAHVRVKSAAARKSAVAMENIKDRFLAKQPDSVMGIPDVLPALVLFELTFERADVVLDVEHMETIVLS